uniref:hypothetical protein n=1 Tax=Rathayibacter sp. VKM Ac-2630 TaxID=1938617 RepID=UPI001F431460|nr:hypothetical protein [Rathayibacter sp. VKM Ac-2630]
MALIVCTVNVYVVFARRFVNVCDSLSAATTVDHGPLPDASVPERATRYPVMSLPPSEFGGHHETVTDVPEELVDTYSGSDGFDAPVLNGTQTCGDFAYSV